MTYSIDFMKNDDLDQIVELELQTGLSIWGYDNYKNYLVSLDTVMLVAINYIEKNRNVIGFLVGGLVLSCKTIFEEFHIYNVAVNKSYRKMGVGSALIEKAISTIKSRGVKIAILEVRSSNFIAQKMYEQLGFSIIAKRKNYYSNPTEDALIMEKYLLND